MTDVRQPSFPLGRRQYLDVAELTGRIAHPDKRGTFGPQGVPSLRRLGADEAHWHSQAFGIETCYWRAVGTVDALLDKVKQLGQYWLKGRGALARTARAH